MFTFIRRYSPFALLVFATACGSPSAPPPPPVAAAPVAAAPETEQQPLQARTQELDDSARERARTVEQQRAAMKKAGLGFEDESTEELTPEQRALLEDRISKERGGRRNLLQEILEKDKRIGELRARVESLSKGLPESHIAAAGDRHDRIAMNFLLSRGVAADAAYQIVSKLQLDDALIPGFRVWTYYANGQFGTWVTQGTAGISPADRQQRLRDEAETLRAEHTALMEQNTTLRSTNERLLQRAEAGEADASAALNAAEAARAEAVAASNQVRYVIGSKRTLERAHVIDGRLRLLTLELPDAQVINLASRQNIVFEPQSYDAGLKRVKRVRVAPASFVENVDYQAVAMGDVGYELRILNPAKFIAAGRFIVVVE